MGNSPLTSWGILILAGFTVNYLVNDINQPYKRKFEGNIKDYVLGYLEKSVRALEAAQVGMHDSIFPKLGGIIEDMFFHNSVNFWQNRTTVV